MCLKCIDWALPCQFSKCCCLRQRFKRPIKPSDVKLKFKPYANDADRRNEMIGEYLRLSESRNIFDCGQGMQGPSGHIGAQRFTGKCWTILVWLWQHFLLCVFWVLFLPPVLIALIGGGLYFLCSAIYQTLIGCVSQSWSESEVQRVDDWSFVTLRGSSVERQRFNFYRRPRWWLKMVIACYTSYCRYFAGLLAARLWTDDMVVLFVHLWSYMYVRFVYAYDEETYRPIRVRGIIDDYTSWSSDASVAEFYDGVTFEIATVFINYEEDCRITFTLRSGEQIKQPMANAPSWDTADLRVWNIVKAHYQCFMSVWPALIHGWSHYHFNDLVSKYNEDRLTHRQTVPRTVLDTVIRANSYYTSSVSGAGANSSFFGPNMAPTSGNVWTWRNFLCAPWKAMPVDEKGMLRHFMNDVTTLYYSDININMHKAINATANCNSKRVTNKVAEVLSARAIEVPKTDSVVPSSTDTAALANPKIEIKLDTANDIDACTVDDADADADVVLNKTANPDAFPPNFVRNRLAPFQQHVNGGEEWCELHRGYSVYKDMLADYYLVIHQEFVRPLFEQNLMSAEQLLDFVQFLEDQGYTGVTYCRRNGSYTHIVSTLLWLNIVHASDHHIANIMVRDFGIGASYVPCQTKAWYADHPEYTFVNVLQGATWRERWRMQYYALKNRVFWAVHGQPSEPNCCVADSLIDSNLYRRFRDVDGIDEQQRLKINAIHDHFRAQMKNVDAKYRWLVPIDVVTAGLAY